MAVTGLGIACSIGTRPDDVARGLAEHRSGIRTVNGLGELPALCSVVEADVPELEDFEDDRKVALLALASRSLVEESEPADPTRRAVFLGTGLSSVTPRELEEDVYPHLRDGRIDRAALMRTLTDGVAPRRHLPERATAWLAQAWGAKGPCGTTFSACAAGAEAIAAGARAIARGEADVALVGGHDAMVHPLGILSFHVLGTLTESGGRPFDRARDGFSLGEGAAVLRLERAGTRPPLAWLLGAGSSLDAHGVTAPHPEGRGAQAAMERALRDAGIGPEAIGWVNAHATGTPRGDLAEAKAIHRLFGSQMSVCSLKGVFGHCLAAAGALEAVATVLALRDGLVLGTYGCNDPDDFDVDVVMAPRQRTVEAVLSNSFGFGGQNCSLVFGAKDAPCASA